MTANVRQKRMNKGAKMQNIFIWFSERFELARGEKGDNLPTMEGLRGFAVFLVFLVHFASLISPNIKQNSGLQLFTNSLHTVGNVGVDLFFVLSGYLIYGSLVSRQQKFFRFISRRIARIYPTFLVVFLLYVGLSFIFPAENKIPQSLSSGIVFLLENIFLLPGLFPIEPMITVAWSLSYEFFYYIIIPLVITVFSMRLKPPILRIVFFLFVGVAFVYYCGVWGGPVRLVMFIAGIVLFDVTKHLKLRLQNEFIGLIAIILGVLSPLLPLGGSVGNSAKVVLVFASFFTLCFVLFSKSSGWLVRWFSWLPLRWLGNMSYSYYLIHGLALKAGFLIIGRMNVISDYGLTTFATLLAVMFMLSTIPATFLFLSIERPFSLSRAPEKKLGFLSWPLLYIFNKI